jgi:eukaryotic-like serine/threonine-protein kinase
LKVGVGDTLDGVYLLEEEVGRGSMGVVYRAVDTVRRVTVAIKVMKADTATDGRFRRLFRREARAMARLNHPGVIQIYGYGITPGDRPYLVMEWVKGRGLHQLGNSPVGLAFVVTLVDRVLEALAHAHARGVIHRDLKPANILLMGDGDDAGSLGRGSVKLVDFGIARVFDVLTSRSDPKRLSFAQLAKRGFNPETRPYEVRLEGTPRYIAPELYRGQEGMISPANDIYAVGVILYEFLAGRPVFDADSEAVLMALQIRGDIPTCKPRPELGRIQTPQRLLEDMLAPDPLNRLDHATEVRRQLHDWYRSQLGSVDDDTVRLPSRAEIAAAGHLDQWSKNDPLNETRSAPSEALAASEPEINLLSWRPMPVYGRAREQAWLWQHVEQLGPSTGASVCVLEGDPGIGKTHLARWLVEIGYEASGVCPLWCGLSSASTLDALRALLDRHFYTTGLESAHVEKRLQQYLTYQAGNGAPFVVPIGQEMSRLVELLRPRKHKSPDPMRRGTTTTLTGNLGAVAFDVGEEVAALVSRVVERAGATRPVVLVFDGMENQHGEGVFRLVDHVMRNNRARPFPVLVIVTAVRGVIDGLRGSARAALDYLVGTEQVTRLALDPIPASETIGLLSRYDSLSLEQRQHIVERAEGNPLFALELAGHALRVEMTDSAEDLALATPEGIRDLWRRRVSIIASRSRVGTVAVRVLEMAAVLGSPLWLDLLNTAWQAPELQNQRHGSDDVISSWDVWIDANVLVEDGGGVYFRHALLRDTLLDDIADAPRARAFHAGAARARRQLDLARTPGDWLRLADHLCAAALHTDAWPFALGAAQHLLLAGELDAARRAFALCDTILEATGGDGDDPRREHVDVGVAQLSWRQGDAAEAQRRAMVLCERARRTGAMRQLGRGELLLAELALHGAATEEAAELFDRALGRFETCADAAGLADCYTGIGRLALRGGRSGVARRNLRQAEQMMLDANNHEGAGQVQLLLAETCAADGNFQTAESHLAAARSAFERAGNPLGEARAVSELGHIAQAKGEMAAAESMFQVYLEKAESMGDIPAAAQARANLAHARLRLGQNASAVELLLQSRQATADLNDRTSLAIVEAILALALAQLGRWPDVAEVFSSSVAGVRDLEIYDIDVAESLELIADADGARDGLGPLYVVLLEEASRQWRNLGNIERAHKLLGRHSGR